jgi:hypothetical protein
MQTKAQPEKNMSEARVLCGASLFFSRFVGIASKFLCSLDFLVLFHQGKRTAA